MPQSTVARLDVPIVIPRLLPSLHRRTARRGICARGKPQRPAFIYKSSGDTFTTWRSSPDYCPHQRGTGCYLVLCPTRRRWHVPHYPYITYSSRSSTPSSKLHAPALVDHTTGKKPLLEAIPHITCKEHRTSRQHQHYYPGAAATEQPSGQYFAHSSYSNNK